MHNSYHVSIHCQDQSGLISAITALLFDLGINLADASFNVMGDNAEFSAICERPEPLEANTLEKDLASLPMLATAKIKVTPSQNTPRSKQSDTATHQIVLQGQDQPGLVARLTEALTDYEANIIRMDTKKLLAQQKTLYLIDLWVWIPESRVEACLATISNTASWLEMRTNTILLNQEQN